MAKHTPGPWKAHFNVPTAMIAGHIIKTDNDLMRPIASLWEGGGTKGKPTQIANAHLIAAAPELLEALRSLLAYTDMLDEGCAVSGNPVAEDPAQSAARAAIAKAEGRV